MSHSVRGYTNSRPQQPQRVVITGLGVISSIGIGRDVFWDHLMSGYSGIGPISSFDSSEFPVHQGAEVKQFDPTAYVLNLSPDSIGRASQFAIGAARLAVQDANLHIPEDEAYDCGVAIGTTSGEPGIIERFDDQFVASHLDEVSSRFIATYPCHVLAAHVACELGLAGAVLTIPTACAAGNHAIARAYDELRSGKAKVMLAGGADAFSRITYAGFARLGAIAPELCQPFDLNRKGMIPGEGAAFLVLETLEHALNRSAAVYSEVAGYGLSCDAYHMTAADPQGSGGVRAMECALAFAGLSPDDVDYISAHGTGTPTNDRLETIAIKRVFGNRAARIPVSGIKSMLGHAMGAASAIEALACVLAIRDGCIPPTINLYHSDPQCDLDYVPLTGRKHEVKVALSNAYAFGGNNSSLLLARYEA